MLCDQILDYFRGRENVIAIGEGSGFRPLHDTQLSREHVESHLAGKKCYGIYLVRQDDTVTCSCVDLDNKPDRPDPEWKEKSERVSKRLTELGIANLTEVSQSGNAAHNWVFFEKPIPAADVRTFWRGIGDDLGITFGEIYPRQDKVEDGKVGNLIRLPLWKKSHFVNDQWETIDAETALTVAKVSAEKLPIAKRVSVEVVPIGTDDLSSRVRQLIAEPGHLSRRWNGDVEGLTDSSQSAVCCSLATMLVKRFVRTDEIHAAIRHWCAKNGYEKGERADWVRLTVDKAYTFVTSREPTEAFETGDVAYQRLTCKDLALGDFQLEYLIKSTLVAKQPCIFAGPKKALKTSLLIDLAISLATQKKFLDKLPVQRRARVAVMSGESGLATIQETAQRIALSKDLELSEIEGLIWSPSLPRFGDPAHAEALRKFLAMTGSRPLSLIPRT